MKLKLLSFVLVLAVSILPACDEAVQERTRLLRFVANTESISRAFEYSVEEAGAPPITVVGEVRDAFSYGGTLEVDGTDVAQEVIADDALGIRVLSPSHIPELAGGTAATAEVVVSALNSGGWVVDPSGAPTIQQVTGELEAGADPIHEAARILRYVRGAIDQAAGVTLWQEKDFDPAYRPFEDNFPAPNLASGERRYDLLRQFIPRPTASEQGVQSPIRVPMFRKMAIYVRDNRVIRVLEEVDIDGHRDFVDARRRNREGMLELLERIKRGEGVEGTLVARKMAVRFFDFRKEFDVSLPADAPKTNLKGLITLPGSGAGLGEDLSRLDEFGQEQEPQPEGGEAPSEPAPAP